MTLSYDLTTFQILGQKFAKFFVGILVQTIIPKGHFEISWPLTIADLLHKCSFMGMTDIHKYWSKLPCLPTGCPGSNIYVSICSDR